MREFNGYITANEDYVVNYGDRYRNGETISTAFVESTVNEVISKRFVKKQQMRWTKKGAHNLLQVRIQVLNDDLKQTFHNWYVGTHGSLIFGRDFHMCGVHQAMTRPFSREARTNVSRKDALIL